MFSDDIEKELGSSECAMSILEAKSLGVNMR